jgi:hypothetical protein
MRNYILTFWAKITVTYDDTVFPPIIYTIPQVGRTIDDLVSNVAFAEQNERDTDPFGGGNPSFYSFVVGESIKAYFLLDKENLFTMMSVIPGFFFDQCMFNPSTGEPIAPADQLLRCQLADSPRSTGWLDAGGEERV